MIDTRTRSLRVPDSSELLREQAHQQPLGGIAASDCTAAPSDKPGVTQREASRRLEAMPDRVYCGLMLHTGVVPTEVRTSRLASAEARYKAWVAAVTERVEKPRDR